MNRAAGMFALLSVAAFVCGCNRAEHGGMPLGADWKAAKPQLAVVASDFADLDILGQNGFNCLAVSCWGDEAASTVLRLSTDFDVSECTTSESILQMPSLFSADLDIPFRQNSFALAVPQFDGFDVAQPQQDAHDRLGSQVNGSAAGAAQQPAPKGCEPCVRLSRRQWRRSMR